MIQLLRLFMFEWKKNYSKKFIIAVIFVFSILDVFNIFYHYQSDSYFADSNGWKTAYWKLYDRFSGTITSEKLADLKSLYLPLAQKTADMTFNTAINPDSLTGINDFSDYLMLDSYYVADMQMFCAYAKKAEDTAQRAKENVSLYNSLGNTYQARENVKIYHSFHGRAVTSFAYTESYNRMTSYTFSSWLILLIVLFAVSTSFAQEKETQMDMLLKTAPQGYHATAYAKILAAILFAAIVSLWFSVVDYCGFALVYGVMEAGGLPVYALKDFAFSILRCTLWQYFLLAAVSRALGVVLFTLIGCFFSSCFSTSLPPFLMGCVVSVCFCLLANNMQTAYSALWRVLNPAFMLYGKVLYKRTEYVNILGEPVAAPLAAVCWCTVLSTVLFIGIRHVYCSRGLVRSKRTGGRYADFSL